MKTYTTISLLTIFFLIAPLITIVVMTIYGIRTYKGWGTSYDERAFLVTFGIMCCVFVSLINMKKVPESDLIWYLASYSYASRMDLIPYTILGSNPYMNESNKEPLFGALVWLLNRSFYGNIPLYKFFISMMEYSLMVAAIIYFGIKSGFKTVVIMSGIVLMCFFPYIFTSKMNVIRQSLANSIFLFVMIRRFFYNKKEWVGMIVMPLIHTSAAFFIPLLLIPGIDKPFKKSWYLFIIALSPIVIYQLYGQALSNAAADISTSGNAGTAALDRFAQGAVGDYSVSMTNVLICLCLLLYSLIIYMEKKLLSIKGMRKFLFVFIILSIFVLVNKDSQIGGRYVHYVLSIMPFLMMILFHLKKVSRPILFFISFSVIAIFSMYLHYGFWTFDVISGGWVTPMVGFMF